LEPLDLRLGLLPRDLLRIVNEQCDDLRVVDVAFPQIQRESVVPADLLGQLA
jgi:hypothetical protein